MERIKAAALELPEQQLDDLVDALAATRPVRRGAGEAWIQEAERRIELYHEGKLETFDAADVLEDDEWAAEVERRIVEVDSGEVTPIPIKEARAQWRALLR
ncbi:hypothetical protein [Longimicrobium sp.]|jgi:hypothetical protein|uniref:hypothetical protein n=1 Tax=Longimicrobium sp. TaxID=2029185 RepID=UPI002ED8D3D7